MRGKELIDSRPCPVYRITPPMRGKAIDQLKYGAISEDHPRLCGEKFDSWGALIWILGSPPPMRGKVAASCSPRFCNRITPAYAGKSGVLVILCYFLWDHPRLCGEKHQLGENSHQNRGSPRLCGEKCYGKMDRYMKLGSPPPMRGKASWDQTAVAFQWDHPRLCGEKHQAR